MTPESASTIGKGLHCFRVVISVGDWAEIESVNRYAGAIGEITD